MPTKEQLHYMMESDLEFGYPNDRGSEHDAIGERNQMPPRSLSEPKGEVLGSFSWDKENECLKFTANPNLNEKRI